VTIAVITTGSCVLSAEPSRILVDGTAAVVGKSLITVQDAYFYRALQRYREGTNELFERETGDVLKRTVQKMALEEMVFTEMKSFKLQGEVHSEAEEVVRLRKAKDKGAWEELLRRYGRSDLSAIERLSKSLSVEHFLERKVETLTPVITEAEAETYFRQNQPRFQGSVFESLKPSIVRILRKERMEKALEDWVHFLRDKYGLTNFL
jgi:hypothetical protein